MATARKTLFAIADQLVVSGSNFLTLVLVARKLGPDGAARYVYAFSLIVLLGMLASAMIYQNMAADRAKGELDNVEGGKYKHLNAVLSMVSVPICMTVYMLISAERGLFPFWESIWAALFICATQAVDYHRRASYFSGVDAPEWRPLLVSFILYIPRLLGLMVSDPGGVLEVFQWQFLLTMPGLVYFSRDLSCVQMRVGGDFYLERIQRGRWLLTTVPINWIWGQGPVFILALAHGNHVAGIFATVRGVTNFANVAMEMIPTHVTAVMSSKKACAESDAGYYSSVRRLLGFGIALWLAGLLVVFLLGERMLLFILGPEYGAERQTLGVLWSASLFVFFSRLQSMHVNLTGINKVIPVSFVSGIVVLCLSFWLMHSMAQMGMAIALLIGWISIVVIGEILRRHWEVSGA